MFFLFLRPLSPRGAPDRALTNDLPVLIRARSRRALPKWPCLWSFQLPAGQQVGDFTLDNLDEDDHPFSRPLQWRRVSCQDFPSRFEQSGLAEQCPDRELRRMGRLLRSRAAILLNFNTLTWPLVSVNTLAPADDIVVPASAW